MKAHEQVTAAALDNLAFALMGRLHVILRRQTGRVTDIEYMRTDPAYCRHVLELAGGMPNDDLQDICAKLRNIYFGPDGLFMRTLPAPTRLEQFTAPPQDTRPAPLHEPLHDSGAPSATRAYIGRLR